MYICVRLDIYIVFFVYPTFQRYALINLEYFGLIIILIVSEIFILKAL